MTDFFNEVSGPPVLTGKQVWVSFPELQSLVVEFTGTAVRAGDDPLSHRLHPMFAVRAEDDDYRVPLCVV